MLGGLYVWFVWRAGGFADCGEETGMVVGCATTSHLEHFMQCMSTRFHTRQIHRRSLEQLYLRLTVRLYGRSCVVKPRASSHEIGSDIWWDNPRIAVTNMTGEARSGGLDRTPSPASEREDGPPRKRPRTRAPQAATANTTSMAPHSHSTSQLPPAEVQSQTHRFQIQPLHRFKGASASIKRPREVAHFSFDDDHKYVHDDSGINYFVPPPIGADLKEGFDTFRHHEDKVDAHLDAMLKALVETEKKDGQKARAKADFVTWRGMMTKVR